MIKISSSLGASIIIVPDLLMMTLENGQCVYDFPGVLFGFSKSFFVGYEIWHYSSSLIISLFFFSGIFFNFFMLTFDSSALFLSC